MEGQSKQNPACRLLISNYTKQTFKRNSLGKGQFSLLLRRLSFEATSLKMLFKVLKLGRHTYSPLILDAKTSSLCTQGYHSFMKEGTIEISAKYGKHNASIPVWSKRGWDSSKTLEKKKTLGIGLKGWLKLRLAPNLTKFEFHPDYFRPIPAITECIVITKFLEPCAFNLQFPHFVPHI